MKNSFILAAALAFSALSASFVQPADAQQRRCPEGRMTSGECINPSLGAAARLGGILNTQQKFSYSVGLVAPSQYPAHPKPFDNREYGYFQQYNPQGGGTGQFLYSCHPNC